MLSSVLQVTALQTATAETPYLYTVVLNLRFSLQVAKQHLALGASSARHVLVDMSSLTQSRKSLKMAETRGVKFFVFQSFQSSINSHWSLKITMRKSILSLIQISILRLSFQEPFSTIK